MSAEQRADQDRFLFEVSNQGFKVVDFSAREALSEPYEVMLTLAGKDEIPLDDMIQKEALLTIYGSESERYFHGMVNSFRMAGSSGRFILYKAIVVPTLWTLSLEKDCRIFQEMTVKDIVTEILEDAGIKSDRYKFQLKETYPERSYCVQYRETDLNFITRLLEEEGIFYYFEHEENQHCVVFGDSTVNYNPIDGIQNKNQQVELLYQSGADMVHQEETVSRFHPCARITSGKYTHRDYNFLQPSLKLSGTKEESAFKKLERYDYPGGFADEQRGSQLARNRLEEAGRFRTSADGKSNCPRLVPGFTFKLSGQEMADLEKEYVLIRTIHSGSQPQVLEELSLTGDGYSYSNEFQCIPSEMVFRPEFKTPKPYVRGIQTAIVVGPKGEEIYTDEHGRVKVQFHWDRLGDNDEKSSCWIRVSQIWAGAGWGAMHIPRIDQEVVVDFLEGDPDQPVITGRLYHGSNTPPYKLPDEKTKSTLMSKTTPNAKTHNELLMEDKVNETRVVLSNAYGHKITMDEKEQFLCIETRDGNKVTFDDKNKHINAVTTQNHNVLISDEKKKINITSTAGHMLEIDDENQKMVAKTVNGNIITMDDNGQKIEVATEVGGHSMVMNDKTISVTSGGGHSITLDDGGGGNGVSLQDANGNKVEIDSAGNKMTIEAQGGIDISTDGDLKLKAANIILDADMDLKMAAGMNVSSEAGIEHKSKGNMLTAEAAATAEFKSSGMTNITGALVKIN